MTGATGQLRLVDEFERVDVGVREAEQLLCARTKPRATVPGSPLAAGARKPSVAISEATVP
jgi:hypothetical protein